MLLCPWEKLPKNMQNESVRPYYDSLSRKTGHLIVKRIIDILFSIIFIIPLLPIYLLVAIAVKVGSRGPVLFKQERVKQFGKPFFILKYRTMVVDAQKIGAQVTAKNDSRVTRVGKFLRASRIDEIPQLFNVLKGDMTFVGTRPEVPRYVAHYSDEMMATLLLPPGVTGTASIAYRNENKLLEENEDPERTYIEKILPEKMAYNLDYLKKLSVKYDFIVMGRTVKCVFEKDE